MTQPVSDHRDFRVPSAADREAWYGAGYWSDRTLADHVRGHADSSSESIAYIGDARSLTWGEYDGYSTRLAAALGAAGFRRGDRLGVMLPDGPLVHLVYLAAEKAGVTIVGVGPRAGTNEIRHLLGLTRASGLLTLAEHRGEASTEMIDRLRGEGLDLDRHVVISWDHEVTIAIDGDAVSNVDLATAQRSIAGQQLGPDDLFLLNSTSGTTGLPKCVTQHQNRWWYFHQLAVAAGDLNSDDVVMSVIPAPFGFGLWTAHFTPTYLGAPTVLMERFSARGMLDAIETHRVSVLCCVSTQFIMLLNEQSTRQADLSSLRAMFTGGEAVPYERAAEFERTTGASVLQFYGSNETGALSHTAYSDSRDQRLRTAGRVIPEMHVRLFAEDGSEVTGSGERGQPACKGPAMCMGYYRDDRANEQLFTDDGWMRTGDIAVIDADGYLSVVGRVSDFIIRGGKNISAVQVENEIGTHPGVAMVAVVGMPDPVFGERVCAYVVERAGHSISLEQICAHLAARGLGKELFPERLELVDQLEAASGGKVAKQLLRDDIVRKLADSR
ncbi:MAG: class I adenylate-forming enzyme family protein [Ilumatobacteraceae bacterium]